MDINLKKISFEKIKELSNNFDYLVNFINIKNKYIVNILNCDKNIIYVNYCDEDAINKIKNEGNILLKDTGYHYNRLLSTTLPVAPYSEYDIYTDEQTKIDYKNIILENIKNIEINNTNVMRLKKMKYSYSSTIVKIPDSDNFLKIINNLFINYNINDVNEILSLRHMYVHGDIPVNSSGILKGEIDKYFSDYELILLYRHVLGDTLTNDELEKIENNFKFMDVDYDISKTFAFKMLIKSFINYHIKLVDIKSDIIEMYSFACYTAVKIENIDITINKNSFKLRSKPVIGKTKILLSPLLYDNEYAFAFDDAYSITNKENDNNRTNNYFELLKNNDISKYNKIMEKLNIKYNASNEDWIIFPHISRYGGTLDLAKCLTKDLVSINSVSGITSEKITQSYFNCGKHIEKYKYLSYLCLYVNIDEFNKSGIKFIFKNNSYTYEIILSKGKFKVKIYSFSSRDKENIIKTLKQLMEDFTENEEIKQEYVLRSLQ